MCPVYSCISFVIEVGIRNLKHCLDQHCYEACTLVQYAVLSCRGSGSRDRTHGGSSGGEEQTEWTEAGDPVHGDCSRWGPRLRQSSHSIPNRLS